MAPQSTKASTPRLSEVARHVVIPEGITSTGWPAVAARCAQLGVGFDPWQDSIGRIVLGRRADGIYAATVGGVVISIPRQVGKTYLVGWMVFALCLLYPGLTVIWTAHRTRTATRTFQSLSGMAKRPKAAAYMLPPRSTNGEQEVRFRNGSVIMFGAREAGFGRGFEEVDIIIFDEAQILTERALDDMIASTNQSNHEHGALLFYMGTPPRPVDPGEAFAAKREAALSGKSEDLAYIEFSADPDADPDDWEQVAKANPSFPRRTGRDAIRRMRANLLSDESFMREGLGVWDRSGIGWRVIPEQSWQHAADPQSIPTDRFALGIEVAPDLLAASVSLAGRRDDGVWHVELDEVRQSAAWVPGYVEALVKANPQIRTVVVDVAGPISALLEPKGRYTVLAGTRTRVTPVKVADLGDGCTNLRDGIINGAVRHTGQPQMAAAMQVAGKRPLGDTGKWVWSRANAAADITPTQSATLALIGAQLGKTVKPSGAAARSTDTGRRAVVL